MQELEVRGVSEVKPKCMSSFFRRSWGLRGTTFFPFCLCGLRGTHEGLLLRYNGYREGSFIDNRAEAAKYEG